MYNNNGQLKTPFIGEYGAALDSIAGERKDKHTADGVAASKTFRLNLNADRNANYALAA